MHADTVDDRVQAILADVFGLDPDSIGPETSTETVEGWDSLLQLTVVLSLEEEFDIELDDDEAIAAVSFTAIVEIVRSHLQSLEPT